MNPKYTPYIVGGLIGLLLGYFLWKRHLNVSMNGLAGLAGLMNKQPTAMIGSIRKYGQDYSQDQSSKAMVSALMMRAPGLRQGILPRR